MIGFLFLLIASMSASVAAGLVYVAGIAPVEWIGRSLAYKIYQQFPHSTRARQQAIQPVLAWVLAGFCFYYNESGLGVAALAVGMLSAGWLMFGVTLPGRIRRKQLYDRVFPKVYRHVE